MKIPLATRIDITTADDAESSAIFVQTKDKKIAFGLKNKELSRLVALLLEQSQKVAIAKNTEPRKPGRKTITLNPVQSSAVGIGKGRTESERVLQVEIGNLTLAFWTDASTLHGLCNDLLDMSDLDSPQRPH
jgi:hypothetical protein